MILPKSRNQDEKGRKGRKGEEEGEKKEKEEKKREKIFGAVFDEIWLLLIVCIERAPRERPICGRYVSGAEHRLGVSLQPIPYELAGWPAKFRRLRRPIVMNYYMYIVLGASNNIFLGPRFLWSCVSHRHH